MCQIVQSVSTKEGGAIRINTSSPRVRGDWLDKVTSCHTTMTLVTFQIASCHYASLEKAWEGGYHYSLPKVVS